MRRGRGSYHSHGPIWRGATVLVVDDEPSVRELVRRMLEAEGFHVEEATSGESALRLVQARTEPFDLVLTDLAMPRIDGRQVSETLTRYRPSVAVLCMSADPDAVPYIESSDTPVRVLLKPFTSDDLYHAVRDALTRATDLAAVAEAEIVQAHAGLSKLALALEASRTTRVHTLDLSSPPVSCGGRREDKAEPGLPTERSTAPTTPPTSAMKVRDHAPRSMKVQFAPGCPGFAPSRQFAQAGVFAKCDDFTRNHGGPRVLTFTVCFPPSLLKSA